MRVEVINGDIICLFADSQKELALSFCRVQEFYESQNPALYRKGFDAFEFLEAVMDKKGQVNYFADWDGFNVPDNIFKSWMAATVFQDRSKYEENLIDLIFKNVDPEQKYYVIGVLENAKSVLKHELSHAYYYLDPDYRHEANMLNRVFQKDSPDLYKKVLRILSKEFNYNDDVLEDELVAWLSTSPQDEVQESFDVTYGEIKRYVKLYRKLFKKYNTHV